MPEENKKRILVMDDDRVVRDLSLRMFEHFGYEVELCADGDEAISMYTSSLDTGTPYDAVVLDLTIPGGMGGEEAVKRLKQIDPTIKVFVSSGYVEEMDTNDLTEMGFVGAIKKPFKIVEVGALFNEIVG